MASLAKQISKDQVINALEYIIENNISLKSSTKYNLVYKEKFFPPKEVVRWAAKLANIPNWETMTLNGGANTNDPLKVMGFTINYSNVDVNENILKFSQIINELKAYLLGENNILKDFKISNVKDDSTFVWIADNQNVIGDTIAHYEIRLKGGKIYTEIHFEGNQESKDNFHQKINSLPENIEWFTWQKSKSLSFKNSLSFNEENLIEKLANSLLYLEQNIGDKVREIKNNSNSSIILNNNLFMTNTPLNQILYGPPGTGKTYNTINKAIEIINPEFDLTQDRNIVKTEYERLVNEGQIVFTTFHQSMTYEDFIEGIKPLIEENEDGAKSVVYEVKDGIFKEICKNAEKPQFEKLEVVKAYSFDDAFNDLVLEANQKLENNEQLFLPILTENLGLKIVGISDRGNLVLKPVYSETAKEYTVSYSRAEKLQQAYPDLSIVKNIDKEFRAVIGGSNSTAYWSVLNYINNKVNSEKKSTSQSVSLPPKQYVLIIDEINRGNVSQIFGELITLIEEDKRLGNDEALEIILPYSKEKFGVPSNLYIIGTMNTADRSVEALDTALRRRFVFEEMPPKYDLDGLQQELFGFKAFEILQTINKRIEKLLDRDHQIGHAYFINKNETTIIDSFYKNIIPLLQEYFFGDYGKIGLVLGSGFIKIIENESVFANFEHLDYSQFEEKESYEIINHKDDSEGFGQAIKLLMNR